MVPVTATEHTLTVEQCGVPVRVTLDGSGSATLAVPDPPPMFLTVTVYVIGLPGTTALPLPAVSVLTTVKSGTGFVTVDEQPASAVLQGPVVMVAVDVKNTGRVAGSEVVQLYIRNTAASVEQPVRELKGFARVTLAPGEEKQAEFPLGFDQLNFLNVDLKQTVEPTSYKIWVGGSSLATAETSLQLVE